MDWSSPSQLPESIKVVMFKFSSPFCTWVLWNQPPSLPLWQKRTGTSELSLTWQKQHLKTEQGMQQGFSHRYVSSGIPREGSSYKVSTVYIAFFSFLPISLIMIVVDIMLYIYVCKYAQLQLCNETVLSERCQSFAACFFIFITL